MQYLVMIYENETSYEKDMDGPKYRDLVARHRALAAELAQSGVLLNGNGLKPVSTATTIRTTDGRQIVHDGPFAETHEQLGGYYLIEVPDLDAAMAMARRVPLYGDGAIEIRPVIQGG